MKFSLTIYNNLKQKVEFLYKKLKLFKHEITKGRKLAIPLTETITLALYKHKQNIGTKKALYETFVFPCSYKTLVINLNRCSLLALVILHHIMRTNRKYAHLVKHTDSTDIPVCLNKNASRHKTMYGLSQWGHSGKGSFYGLKLHITSDINGKLLSVYFTKGNTNDRVPFMQLNKDIDGIFVADAGYTSEKLEKEFYKENKRILFAKPRKNMKKLMTAWQNMLYDTRMRIEINFRNLKMFYGLVSSLPRSINGYIANYLYSLLSYTLR